MAAVTRFEAAVAHFAQAIEEHRARQCVARFAFVESDLHAPTQVNALQPVQNEQRSFDPSQLAQRRGQPILARITAELSHEE